MRRWGLPIAVFALAAACGGGQEQAGTARPDAFRVALLTPGSIADGGWNAGAYQGLLRIRDELGAQVSHVETRTPAAFEEGFRDYAQGGYDLVFGHGFEYQEAAARVAAGFPDTVFVTTSGNTIRPNVAAMIFELEQATWLCGLLAARMSRTGTLGLVGGIDLPSIRSTFVAFQAGARSVAPQVRIPEVFVGSFGDVASAREAALALIEEGADFLLHQANEAGRGVFQAVSDRSTPEAPVYAFGTNRNQNGLAPDVVIASATLDLPGAFVQVARRVEQGGFTGELIRLGMAEGVVDFVPNPALAGAVPQAVWDEVEAARADILSGAIVVPREAF